MAVNWDFIKKEMGSLQEDKSKLKKYIFPMKILDQEVGCRLSFFLDIEVNLPCLHSDQRGYHFVLYVQHLT